MTRRAPIVAGQTVIVLQLQDQIDAALNGVKQKLRKFSTSIGNIGLDLFRGGLLGTLPGGLILNEFKKFEDQILFLKTKVKATEAEFQQLVGVIRELGRTTSYTATEVADGATILAQAGLTAKQVMDTLQPTLDLARGAQITLSQAGEILANTMTSFRIETSKANEVASQFIAAASAGTLDVLDLKESIKEVLGTVRILNIDLPTTLALLTELSSRSLRGTKAGTSLNTALLQLASKQNVLAKKFGINVPNNFNGNDFIKFLEQLYEKISKLGNLQQVSILQRIFNIRGARAIAGLDTIQNIIRLTKEIRAAGNSARKAAVTMDSGFGGSLRRATSAVNDLTISLGKLFAGPVGKLLDLVPNLALSFQELATENPHLVLTLAAIPPAMLAIGGASLVASFAVGKLASAVGGLLGLFRSGGSLFNKALTANLITGIRGTRAVSGGFKGIDQGLSAMFLTPQLRGGKGRNARKVVPSSFFGRLGRTSVPFAATLGGLGSRGYSVLSRAGSSLSNKLTSANFINAVTKGLMKLDRVIAITQKGIYSLSPPMINLLRLFTAASAVFVNFHGLPFQNARQFYHSINTIRASLYRLLLDVKALGPVIQTTFANSISSIARFGFATKSMLAKGIGAFKWSNINDLMIRGGEGARRLIQGGRTALNKSRSIRGIRATSYALSQVMTYWSKGKFGAAIDTGRWKRVASILKGSTLAKGAGILGKGVLGGLSIAKSGTVHGITAVTRAIAGLWRVLSKIDIVRTLYLTFRGIGMITMSLLRAANAVRRFVFSFGGFLTIVELLIIFGPKIDIIRQSFERLGKGISNAFSQIANIGKAIAGGPFTLLSAGMSQIFSGNGEQGINSISQALLAMASIVKNQLLAAWSEFMIGIAPLYDFLRKVIGSLLELGKLLFSVFGKAGAEFGNLFKGGPAEGGLSGLLKNLYNSVDLKEVMKFIGGFFTTIAKNIAWQINMMVTAVVTTMIGVQDALATLFSMFASIAESLFGATRGPQIAAMANLAATTLNVNANALRMNMENFAGSLKDTEKGIDKALENFLIKLEAIFAVDTEKNNRIAVIQHMTETMIQEEIAALTASGRGLVDVYDQILHAQMFPTTSVWATTKGKGPGINTPIPIGSIPINSNPLNELAKKREDLRNQLFQEKLNINDLKNGNANFGGNVGQEIRLRRKAILEGQRDLRQTERLIKLFELGRIRGPQAQQAVSIQEIVAATVGSFDSTRRNLAKAGGKNQQLEALQSIDKSLGGDESTPYLKQILNKTGPLTIK